MFRVFWEDENNGVGVFSSTTKIVLCCMETLKIKIQDKQNLKTPLIWTCLIFQKKGAKFSMWPSGKYVVWREHDPWKKPYMSFDLANVIPQYKVKQPFWFF